MTLPPDPAVRGFLPDEEGQYLHQLALEGTRLGPALEIGSYCGRSTLWLADAARHNNSVVFAVDHHRGSEEHQPGEFFHDAELTDDQGRFDSLPEFRRNIQSSGLADTIIPVITSASVLANYWQSPLGLLFIDGGHSLDTALADYRGWSQYVAKGAILAIHDVYPNADAGGQAPFTIWQMADQSGLFETIGQCGSLRALRRLG